MNARHKEIWLDTLRKQWPECFHALAAVGYHVVQEGTVPPWMVQHDDSCRNDGQGGHWHLRPPTDESPTPNDYVEVHHPGGGTTEVRRASKALGNWLRPDQDSE